MAEVRASGDVDLGHLVHQLAEIDARTARTDGRVKALSIRAKQAEVEIRRVEAASGRILGKIKAQAKSAATGFALSQLDSFTQGEDALSRLGRVGIATGSGAAFGGLPGAVVAFLASVASELKTEQKKLEDAREKQRLELLAFRRDLTKIAEEAREAVRQRKAESEKVVDEAREEARKGEGALRYRMWIASAKASQQ